VRSAKLRERGSRISRCSQVRYPADRKPWVRLIATLELG